LEKLQFLNVLPLASDTPYCKIEDLEALKTLLLNQGISLQIDKAQSGQIGQGQTVKIRDL
jgi:hypothetical protein